MVWWLYIVGFLATLLLVFEYRDRDGEALTMGDLSVILLWPVSLPILGVIGTWQGFRARRKWTWSHCWSINWPLRRWDVGLFRGHPLQCPRPRYTLIAGPFWLHIYRSPTAAGVKQISDEVARFKNRRVGR